MFARYTATAMDFEGNVVKNDCIVLTILIILAETATILSSKLAELVYRTR